VILKESISKHYKDVHEKSNKRQCDICSKVLSGPFSLKEHISAVHNKQTKHECPHCKKMFAHFSNMNRHIRLIHDKMVVTHKYVNCPVCQKVVQSTSLKKHMAAIHEQRRDFKCLYCEKRFAQSYTLKEHTAAKHTFEYEHSCKLCAKAFAHKTNCGRHLKTVHKEELKDKYETEQDMIKDCIAVGKVDVRDLKMAQRALRVAAATNASPAPYVSDVNNLGPVKAEEDDDEDEDDNLEIAEEEEGEVEEAAVEEVEVKRLPRRTRGRNAVKAS